MLIKFRILWVEDDQDFINLTGPNLRRFLNDLGFDLEVVHIKNPETDPVEEYLTNTSEYDLMLVDWHFKIKEEEQDHPVGGEVIERIRNMVPYSDIIFYSGKRDLDKELKSRGLQGVYIANRLNLRQQAKDHIEFLLRKSLHPKVMRGIIVSALSSLDDLCYKIIKHKAETDDQIIETVRSKISNQSEKHYNDKQKLVKREAADFINRIHSTMNLDSFQRSEIVSEIVSSDCTDNKVVEPIQALPSVVQKRNKLAHWKRAEETDEHILLVDKEKEYEFDQEEAAEIRKGINAAALALDQYIQTFEPAE